MAETKDGGPAFPQTLDSWCGKDGNTAVPEGMSLRDYFAAKAMQGMVVAAGNCANNKWSNYAKDAYELADAMLAARSLPVPR